MKYPQASRQRDIHCRTVRVGPSARMMLLLAEEAGSGILQRQCSVSCSHTFNENIILKCSDNCMCVGHLSIVVRKGNFLVTFLYLCPPEFDPRRQHLNL